MRCVTLVHLLRTIGAAAAATAAPTAAAMKNSILKLNRCEFCCYLNPTKDLSHYDFEKNISISLSHAHLPSLYAHLPSLCSPPLSLCSPPLSMLTSPLSCIVGRMIRIDQFIHTIYDRYCCHSLQSQDIHR